MAWKRGNRLRLVQQAGMDSRVARVLEDIKHSLGLATVGSMYGALAAYPEFLETSWRAIKPSVHTVKFLACAGRLRAGAFTRVHSYLRVPDLRGSVTPSTSLDELVSVVDIFHQTDSILLILCAFQLQALDGPAGMGAPSPAPQSVPTPPTLQLDTPEQFVSPLVKRTLSDIRRTFQAPFDSVECVAFGRWPEFLVSYWRALRPVVTSPLFHHCQRGIREDAWQLARELPGPVEELTSTQLLETMSEEDVASIVRITEFFFDHLSALVLCVAFAKIAAEGGTRYLRESPPASISRVA